MLTTLELPDRDESLVTSVWEPSLPKGACALHIPEPLSMCNEDTVPFTLREEILDWCEESLCLPVRLHFAHLRRVADPPLIMRFGLWVLFGSEVDRVAFRLRWL